MGRPLRAALGEIVSHVLTCANGGYRLCEGDCLAFVRGRGRTKKEFAHNGS